MSRLSLVASFFVVLLQTSFMAQAQQPNTALSEVAQNSYWHHLLHYRPQGIMRKTFSQGDDPTFFLSPEGMLDPLAELQAEVSAFAINNMADNQSAQCRFPARYFWIKQQLPQSKFIDQPCSDFDQFNQAIDGHSLTIIFPASYLNSPSSMYGHTLVRIDREDEKRSKLLSYSVNFAANADPTDNDIVFSYKGLAGGYPGVVSVVPYYQKVNEYSSLESRDIWEYKLKLTKPQVDQFVRHIWETQDTFFDYYFMGENCSYRLLALLDAAVPELNLAGEFPFKAVPVDTVRILHDQNLVQKITYRPSALTELNYMREQSPLQLQDLAQQLILQPDADLALALNDLSEAEQAQVLELAFAYSRYLSVQEKQASPELRKASLKILSARSKISLKDVFKSVPTPVIRDDEGHNTQRVSIALGATEDDIFTQLGYRLTYHDLLDPIEGYLPGAQIQMGNLNLRQYEDEDLRVEQFTLIDILSLSTRNNFVKPTAWRISTGFERLPGVDGPGYWTINGGGGVAYDVLGGLVYGLLEAELDAGSDIDKDYRVAAGGQLGYLYQQGWWQTNVTAQWQDDLAGMSGQRTEYKVGLAFNPSQNFQLRLNWHQLEVSQVKQDDWSLGLGVYF